MSDEVQLLNRAKALDQAALALIHEQQYDALFRYFSFRVADRATAEDLTSDVFARFLKAIRDKNAPPNTIRGWLYGAANLVLKEHYRWKKKTSAESLSDYMPDNETLAPEENVAQRWQKAELRDAISQLTEDQQQILGLRFGYNMPIREVAETVNKSEGSVKMLQVRAIAALARQLGSEDSHE